MDDQALRDYFHFDEADLNANRNGLLSEKQQQTLLAEDKSGRRGCLVIGLIGGLVLFAIAASMPIELIPSALQVLQHNRVGDATGMFVGVGIWALIWGGIGCVLLWVGISSAFRKTPTFTLKSVVGPINLVAVERRTSSGMGTHTTHTTYIEHELHIGDQIFDVGKQLGNYLMQGEVYAIYYIKDDRIMSLERLSKG